MDRFDFMNCFVRILYKQIQRLASEKQQTPAEIRKNIEIMTEILKLFYDRTSRRVDLHIEKNNDKPDNRYIPIMLFSSLSIICSIVSILIVLLK